VNLLTNRGFGFSNADSKKAFDETKEFGYMISLTQLVILKDKKTKNTIGFLMTHIGDKPCLEKSKFDLRKGNSYLKKEKDFDGMVIYHDLEGKFVNGWKFLKGKVTHTVKFPENQKVEVNLKNAQSNCFTEYVTEWWYVKQYDSYAGVGDDMVYKGTDYDWITVTYATTVCYWDAAGAGGSGDGGGSGGGYDPAPEQPQPVLSDPLKRLFVNGSSNLSATDIDNLNKAFNEMNNDCMLNSISNFLASNNITLGSVSINSTMPNPTSLNNFGDITFGDSDLITAENLSHEWVHLAQQKMSNVNVFTSSNKGMAEFEVALFFDIKNAIWRCGDFTSYTDHTMACYNGSYDQYRPSYQAWLLSITEGGTKYPGSIDQSQFFYWANIFGDVSKYKKTNGYQYTNSSYSPCTIIQLINNCR